jgi:hypothetical protein
MQRRITLKLCNGVGEGIVVVGVVADGATTGADLQPVQFSVVCSLRLTIMGAAPITIRALPTMTGLQREMRWPTVCNGSDRMILVAAPI